MPDRTATEELKAVLDLCQARELKVSRVRVGDVEVEFSGPPPVRTSTADEPSGTPPTGPEERQQRKEDTHRLLGIPQSIFSRNGRQ